jgi:hypothetical protein
VSGQWGAGLPNGNYGVESGARSQAFMARVKAMHHWIRKGVPDKAAARAREVFSQAKFVLRDLEQKRSA